MKKHLDWFSSYTDTFLAQAGPDNAALQMKVGHTLRVLKTARLLTRCLKLDKKTSRLTHMAALYHDLGRFPQYRLYHTLNDGKSVNHALLSFRTMREAGCLSELGIRDRRLVLRAVFLHNRPFLPPNLPMSLDLITRILRDADKLDIYAVIIGMLGTNGEEREMAFQGLKQDPEAYTPQIIDLLWTRRQPPLGLARSMNDYLLFLCGWIYDLNFSVSCRMIHKRRQLEALFADMPKHGKILRLHERMREDLYRLGRGEVLK